MCDKKKQKNQKVSLKYTVVKKVQLDECLLPSNSDLKQTQTIAVARALRASVK